MKIFDIRAAARLSVVALSLSLVPAAALSETLRDAMVAAYKHSNLLDQNRALLRAADEDVAIALSALRPSLAGQVSINQTDTAVSRIGGTLDSTISLGLELLVWDGGATALGVEAAKETVLAGRQQLRGLEQQVLLNAIGAYLQVQRDTRVVTLRQSNLRLITQELRAARDRFEVGEVTRTDVAQAEARLAQARGDLADAQGTLEISKELYKVTVGKKPGRLTGVNTTPKLPSSAENAAAVAVQNHPSIGQAQREIKANELNARRATASIKPNIRLNAGVSHNSENNNGSSLGLTMTVPIYQGGQLRALERRANAVVHASRANLHQVVLQIRQSVADSWSQLRVARAQLAANERQIRAAQIAFDGVREEATLGARTTLDVLDAEQALLDARTNRVIFETQVFAAAYQLISSMGLLTVSELNLPVPQYDPNEYYNAVKNAPVRNSKQGEKLDRILQRYQK